jgi:hypothetical protein
VHACVDVCVDVCMHVCANVYPFVVLLFCDEQLAYLNKWRLSSSSMVIESPELAYTKHYNTRAVVLE